MPEFHFTHPGYVPILDQVFDIALGECSPAEFKVLAAILRKTFGYGKLADRISYSQLIGMTHLSKRAVMLAVKSLEVSNWIVKYKWSGLNWYMIKLDEKMVYSVSKQNFHGKLSTPPWYTEYTNKLSKEVYSVSIQETDQETNIETVVASLKEEETDTRSNSLKILQRWYYLSNNSASVVTTRLRQAVNFKLEPDAILFLNNIGLDTDGNPLAKEKPILQIHETRLAYIAAE